MKSIRNLSFVLFLISSVVVTVVAQSPEPPEIGDVVKCQCTILGKCKASGGGVICAQRMEEPVNCDDYNSNC